MQRRYVTADVFTDRMFRGLAGLIHARRAPAEDIHFY
jgi:hypothetical protein